MLLVGAEAARIATDGRYHEQARLQAPAFELVPAPLRRIGSFAADLLAGLGGKTVGVEAAHLTVAEHAEWVEAIELLAPEDRPPPRARARRGRATARRQGPRGA